MKAKTTYAAGILAGTMLGIGAYIVTNDDKYYKTVFEQRQEAIDYEGANGYDVWIIKPSENEVRIIIGNLDASKQDFDSATIRGIKRDNGQFRIVNYSFLLKNAPPSLLELCSPERLDDIERKILERR